MCKSVFMCVQVCEPIDIHWKPEVDIRCPSISLPTLFQTAFLTELEACLCNVDETGWPVSPRDLPVSSLSALEFQTQK